jgi:hypothetical protein
MAQKYDHGDKPRWRGSTERKPPLNVETGEPIDLAISCKRFAFIFEEANILPPEGEFTQWRYEAYVGKVGIFVFWEDELVPDGECVPIELEE